MFQGAEHSLQFPSITQALLEGSELYPPELLPEDRNSNSLPPQEPLRRVGETRRSPKRRHEGADQGQRKHSQPMWSQYALPASWNPGC